MTTPERRPAQLIEEPITFVTPGKAPTSPGFDLAHTPKRSMSYGAPIFPRPAERFDSPPAISTLEQQVVDKLRKDGYLLSLLKRSLRKDVEEQLHLARREMEVLFSRELRALRDFTNAEVQILSSEMKELRRERREHTAEALSKLCTDMEVLTKDCVSQQSLRAALGEVQQEMTELLQQGRARESQAYREELSKELAELRKKLQELSSSFSDASRESGSRLATLEADVARLRAAQAEKEGESAEQLRGMSGKVEGLRGDLASLQAKMASSGPEVSDLRGQVKQLAAEVISCRRRCEDVLSKEMTLPLETSTSLRLSTLEEQVNQISASHMQLLGVREQLTALTNSSRGHSESATSLAQRFSLLEGEVCEMRGVLRPQERQEPDQRLRLQQSQLAARLEQLTDQFAAFEEKLTPLFGLAPRLGDLERQANEARRTQEQLQVSLPSAGSADLRAAERRLELRQDDANAMHSHAVQDLRNDLVTLCSELNGQTLKLAKDSFEGCLDRLASLERQGQERTSSQRGLALTLQSLVDEGCMALEVRLKSLEAAQNQQLSLATVIEDAATAARRPVEVQLGVLEAELSELRRDRAETTSLVLPRLKTLERQQEEFKAKSSFLEDRLQRAETESAEFSDFRGSLNTLVSGITTSVLAGSSVAQEVSQLSARVVPLFASLDRQAEELGSLAARVATLPVDPVSSQQVAIISEELGGIKARLSALPEEGVASTSSVERCVQQVRSLEDAIKTVSWDLDGAEKQLRELAMQFSAVNGNIANLDGQMEIVTGLIHRMDTMARFLQHVQDRGAPDGLASGTHTMAKSTHRSLILRADVMRERVVGAIALPGRFEPQDIRHLAINAAGTYVAAACNSGQVYIWRVSRSSRRGDICLDPFALSVPGWLGPLSVLALAFADATGVEEVLGVEGIDILVCLLSGELRLLDPGDGRCAGTVVVEAAAAEAATPCWSYNFSGARGSDREAVVALDFEANTLVLASRKNSCPCLRGMDANRDMQAEDQPGQSPIQISRLRSEPLPLLAAARLVQGDSHSAPWLFLWSQTGHVLRCDLGLSGASFSPAGQASARKLKREAFRV
eukprot:s1882_g10.t2